MNALKKVKFDDQNPFNIKMDEFCITVFLWIRTVVSTQVIRARFCRLFLGGRKVRNFERKGEIGKLQGLVLKISILLKIMLKTEERGLLDLCKYAL